MTGRPVVVVDLDSTVADTRNRHHLSPHADDTKTWADYALACESDLPMPGTVRLIQMLYSSGYAIHFVSGRSVEALDATVDWLRAQGLQWHQLRLHYAGDIHNNATYKVQHIQKLQRDGHNVVLMLEDWPAVAQMVQDECGVPVLLVNPNYKDQPMADSAAFIDNGGSY